MIPGMSLLQRGKVWYYAGMFISFVGSVMLSDHLNRLITGYINNKLYVTMLTYIVMFLLAFYIFPWLINKTLGVSEND